MERGEAGREEQKVRPGPYCSVEGKANCGLAPGGGRGAGDGVGL